MLYQHLIYTGSDKNNIFLRKEKTIVKVTKFEINEDDQLIICPGQLVVGRLGVHKIELIKHGQLDQTVIETECDILTFSPLFGDSIMKKVWRWAQGEKITDLPCAHSIPKFTWKFEQ